MSSPSPLPILPYEPTSLNGPETLGSSSKGYPAALKIEGGLEDIDLSDISNPWNCGLGQANVLLESPLGRGWLVIQGGRR